MDFTFCSFTYNQQDLIITHLESIKYQIRNYGAGINCKYLLADDCSQDNTVKVVEEWLKCNSDLFCETKLLVSNQNHGNVANFVIALKNIDTEYFKILAGDDFYYKTNVFEVLKNGDFVISPVLFYDGKTVVDRKNDIFNGILCCGEDSETIKQYILSQYRFAGGIAAPGVFVRKSIIDDGLYETLAPYKWIEDAPEFHYLLSKKETRAAVTGKPYIVYRISTGISRKENNPNWKEYLRDGALLDKNVHVLRRHWPKYINPYFYMRALGRARVYFSALFSPVKFKRVLRIKKTIDKEKKFAPAYIDEIVNG